MKPNQGYCYTVQVDHRATGMTVLSFLSQRFIHSSEMEWSLRIREEQVLLDGKPAEETQLLSPGMVLTWNRPGWIEEDTPQSYQLVFEDEHLLAVNKPSGLPTLPGGGFYLNTLLSFVRREFPDARPLHRLGRGTSGLVLFALNSESARNISHNWSRIRKQYQALSQSAASRDRYDIRAPIGMILHPRLGRVHAADFHGKPARSVAIPIARRDDSTIFEIDLHSGRPHQIRIHLAFIGHPLVGDPMYARGGRLLDSPGLPGDLGYHLHAKRLCLEHPISHQRLEINSELPSALQVEMGEPL